MFTIPEPFIPDTPPLSDTSIRKLVKFSNEHGTEFGITLILDSGIISGTVIPAHTYFEELQRDLEVATEQSPPFKDLLLSIAPDPSNDGLPNYVHLRDAKFFVGDRSIPTGKGFLWRGRISKVTGFTMGNVTIS